ASIASTSLITITPTTGDVVIDVLNQEIDTTGDNTFYGENTGNEGSRNVLATVNTGVGSGSFLVLDEGVGNGSWGADNFPLLTDGNANQVFGRNSGTGLVDGSNNLFFGNNLAAPASNTSNYITFDDAVFINSDTSAMRVGGSGVVAGQSIFQVVNDATDDTSSVIFIENSSATNGADIQMRFGNRDPVAFSAIDGSIYFRADDGNSTIYVNTSTTSGTDWFDIKNPTSGAAGIIQTSDGADGFTSGNLVVIDESSISLRDPFTTASSSSGTLALDFSVDQFIQVTLTENITTINITMPAGPSLKRLRIIQDPVTARSMTGWTIAGGAVRWQGGVEFVPTSIVDAIDKIVLDFDATNIDATYGLDFS
ncbi:MAG: hypothetical protein ACE1ZA_05725, partial [Pseudomonadales bacterium]